MLILCGCGVKDSHIGKPTAVVTEFNKYVKEGKADIAYSLFSQRIKKKLSLEDFTKIVKPKAVKEELDEMLKSFEIQVDNEEILGDRANVYGTVKTQNGVSYFREKCVLEYNAWKIDSEVMEDRHPDLVEYYRDIDLHRTFAQYCESMLDGKAEVMYEMSSSAVKAIHTLDLFKAETTNTGSSKTPRQEDFKIEAVYAYSDDKGNGLCIMKMGNPTIGTKEMMSGIYFKLPWKFENGIWKADYAKIDESFKMNIESQ